MEWKGGKENVRIAEFKKKIPNNSITYVYMLRNINVYVTLHIHYI